MKKYFKIFVFILFLLSLSFGFAEEVEYNVVDADYFSIFCEAEASNDFSLYETTLITDLTENTNESVYAEAVYYVYFYIPFYGLEQNENYVQIKKLVDGLLTSSYSYVTSFFKFKANSSLAKKYNIGTEFRNVEVLVYIQPEDFGSILGDKDIKVSLLDSISEVEAMYRRFVSQTSQDESSSLRFSDEAYIQLTKKPNLVYVMKNEPEYAPMYEAYLFTGQNINGISFGDADSYYRIVTMLEDLDLIAKENGIVLSEVFSSVTNSIVKLYHTSPYYLTSLSGFQLDLIEEELSFIYQYSMYTSRILDLLKK